MLQKNQGIILGTLALFSLLFFTGVTTWQMGKSLRSKVRPKTKRILPKPARPMGKKIRSVTV